MPRAAGHRYRTDWDLARLYASAHDPQIERDVEAAEAACADFAKRYAGKSLAEKDALLLRALTAYEQLSGMPEFEQPLRYFMYRRELDATDSEAEKQLNKLSDRLTKAGNQLLFFELSLGKLSKARQKALLKDARFAHFRYYLEQVFAEAKHRLTEPEERILNLKSLPASSLWVAGSEKILNQRSVRHGGKELPLMEALNLVGRMPKAPRRALWKKAITECEQHAPIAENELNAVVLNQKTNDELRSYSRPYSATVYANENTDREVEALVDAVTKGFGISRRYYTLKTRLLGEAQLLYPDKNASYGKRVTVPFTEAVDTLREVFGALHPEYRAILDRMLESGQIDAFPKKGKAGGAFCASGIHQPTMVLLNHVDDTHSLRTFAHEMGHAVHAERAKGQTPLYEGHSTAVAETASTLFENLVFESLLTTLSPREQLAALHEKLGDEVAAIMRQVAFFNFELELHETIRREGSMTKEEMAAALRRHLQDYLGKSVEVAPEDGYSFVYIPHFRMSFYVYTYAYGSLVSNVIAEKWKADPQYIEQIDQFLSAGSSASPVQIFRDIGITTADPAFFAQGLKVLDARVRQLEKLATEQGAI